jgi:hypothetical protein
MMDELNEVEITSLRAAGFTESADVLGGLWRQFSEIQQASFLLVTVEAIERFRLWRETGADEDAWA